MKRNQCNNLIECDFSKAGINLYIVIFAATLLIGYFFQTDQFELLNTLPRNRNPIDSLESVNFTVKNGNTVVVDAIVSYIYQVTIDNFLDGISIHAKHGPLEFVLQVPHSIKHSSNNGHIHFENLLECNGPADLQAFFYDDPISDIITFNISTQFVYTNHTIAKCVQEEGQDICHFSYVCYDNHILQTFFVNGFHPHSSLYATANNGEKILIQNTYEPFSQQQKVFTSESSLLLFGPRKAWQDKWWSMRETLGKAATALKHNHILDDDQNWFADPGTAWHLHLKKIDESTPKCFTELDFNYHDDHLKGIRNNYLSNLWNVDDSEFVVLGRWIENWEEIADAICPNCSVKVIKENEENYVAIAAALKSSKYVLGLHSDFFVNIIAASPNATVIDILPRGMKCGRWILDAAEMSGVHTIIGEIGKDLGGCGSPSNCWKSECSQYRSSIIVEKEKILKAIYESPKDKVGYIFSLD